MTLTKAMCLGTLLIAGSVGAALGATPDEITVHVSSSSRAVQAFSSSHSLADLRTAVDEMVAAGNLHALKPDTFVAQRRTLVRGWGQVFKAIEDSYDPTYDPNDRNNWPAWGLPDPQGVQDPKARAAAVAAITANQQKIKRASYYHDLNVIDLIAQNALKVQLNQFRKVEPDGTDADFAGLDGILQRSGLSHARRMKINAMFYARPGG